MTDRPDLHVVGDAPQLPAEPPAAHAHADLASAVACGQFLCILKAQQKEVATLLDEGAGAQTAQLHRTLTSLSETIRDYEDLVGVQKKPRTPDEKFKGA